MHILFEASFVNISLAIATRVLAAIVQGNQYRSVINAENTQIDLVL